MADNLTIEVDARSVLQALDRLDDRIGDRLKAVAKDTAERIRTGAIQRLSAQTQGTGQTAAALTIDEINGGYRLYVGPVPQRSENVPLWLEFGTRHMSARPWLFKAALLEEGPHFRRVAEAVDAAIAGLGD